MDSHEFQEIARGIFPSKDGISTFTGLPAVTRIKDIMKKGYIPEEGDIGPIEQALCSLPPNLPAALELTEVLEKELVPKRPDLAFRVFSKAVQADHLVSIVRNGVDPTKAQAPADPVWLGYFYAMPLARIARAHLKYQDKIFAVLRGVLETRNDINTTGLKYFARAAGCLSGNKAQELLNWLKVKLSQIGEEKEVETNGVEDLIEMVEDRITRSLQKRQETSIT